GGGRRRCPRDPDRDRAPNRPRAGGVGGRRDIPRRRRGSRRLSTTTPLLFGADPTPGLVAAALADDGRSIRLWIRDGAATPVDSIAFKPFLLAAEEALVGGAAGLVTLTHLNRAGGLCWRPRLGPAGAPPPPRRPP